MKLCIGPFPGRPEIAEAVHRQSLELSYVAPFQHGHPAAFELAERLCRLTPEGLDHVFFTNSGSESVETALKMALLYHHRRGEAQRTRFVGRERGYHGVNFGGMSVGGIGANRDGFGPGLPGVVHMRHTLLPDVRFHRGQPSHGAELADDLQRTFAAEVPAIPLYPNPSWAEYNTSRFTGFPSAEDPYADPSPNKFIRGEVLLVLTTLAPR